MPADVMAPPAVADIGRGRGEKRLEGKALPGDVGIAGKADRISVPAKARPAGEDETAFFAVASQIQKMEMVQNPQRIQAGSLDCVPCCQSIHQKSTPASSWGW